MAKVPAEISRRVRSAVRELSKNLQMESAFLFGSYVTGKNHRFSDIDIGVFVKNLSEISLLDEFAITARIARNYGSDLEFHFFDASDPATEESVSFAAEVRRTGVKISA